MPITVTVPLKKFEFFPDKPKETSLSCLSKLDNGKWSSTIKIDGFNLFMCNDGETVESWSRTWKPLPVAKHLKDAWMEMVKTGKIPDKSIINCEWMKMRAGSGDFKYDGPECIYLLTPYVMEGLFIGYQPYSERRRWLESLGLPVDDLNITKSSDQKHGILLPAKVESNFLEFFEAAKKVPRTEGIVLNLKTGTLVANQVTSIKSEVMLKCRWRRGDDGRTEV
jgi:hypothetical protein